MSELSFAKSFLSTLDSRPIKLRADHVFDPEQVGLRVPVSLLYALLRSTIISQLYQSLSLTNVTIST